MKIDITVESEDLDAMHDVVYEVTGKKPSEEDIMIWWNRLTHTTKMLAVTWGCSDTVFRDEMYTEMKNTYKFYNFND